MSRLLSRLPTEEQSEEVFRLFYTHRQSLNFTVHWPSFMQRYKTMRASKTTSLPFIGLVTAVMAQGKQVLSHIAISSSDWAANTECSCELYQLSVDALNLADSYGLPYDLDYVQAGTLQCNFLLHCIDRNPVERRIWPRLGALITIAMQMGLHRDPEIFNNTFSVFEQEMRRRTWWNLYICDRSLSSKLSYPPHINDRECSCKLPANASDSDITSSCAVIDNSPNLTEKWYLIYQCHAAKLRGIMRETELREAELSNESIDELEASMMLVLSSIPKPEEFGPKMETHRCLAMMCLHAAIVRLYNQFIQNPGHPLYLKALSKTLTSCHQIITACYRIIEIREESGMTTFVPHFWYTPYCFTAGVIVGACLVQRQPVLCVKASRDDLQMALRIFQKLTESAGKEGESAHVLEMFWTAIENCKKIAGGDNCLTVGPDRFIMPSENDSVEPSKLHSQLSVTQCPCPECIMTRQQFSRPPIPPVFDDINIGLSMDCLESAIFEFDCFGRTV